MADREDEALILGRQLQRNLENFKVNYPELSTLAQKGDDKVSGRQDLTFWWCY